jgi:hypothetical protein
MMDEDWRVLTSLLPENWKGAAVSTHALKGLRKDKSAERLLRTLLLHIACGYSLRETVVRARRAGLADLSDVALLKRLRKSTDWLRELCVALFNERGVQVGSPAGLQFRLFDATNVREPGKTGSLWRVHYSVRVPSLECDHFTITPTEGEGTGESLDQFPIEAGDYIIADRGYSRAAGIHHAASRGAFVCVRLNAVSVVLLDADGNPFDLVGSLRPLTRSGAIEAWSVLLPSPNTGEPPLPGRICAIRKSKEAIRLAHKKLRRRASKKGHKLQPETLFLAQYVIVLTTFPGEHFSPAEVLNWYRIRWQVELVFKRFKQIAQLGHLPKHDDESAKAWLYGKLFAALMTERVIAYAESLSPWGYDLVPQANTEPMAGVHVCFPPTPASG